MSSNSFKVISISRGGLELARGELRKPALVVGRSPTCDIVLRAQGVAPVHFIVEWMGDGKFDPSRGTWSIIDVSASAEADAEDAFGSGAVLSDGQARLGPFAFKHVEDRLVSGEVIGGGITASLDPGADHAPSGGALLEVIQSRWDTGAIEEVLHLRKGASKRPIEKVRELRLDWKGAAAPSVQVQLEKMPGAQLTLQGKRVVPAQAQGLRGGELLRIRWRSHDFYLRFVDPIRVPGVPHSFFEEAGLRWSLLTAVVAFGLMGLLIRGHVASSQGEPQPEPRVARVLVKEAVPPPPPPAPTSPLEAPEVALEGKSEELPNSERAETEADVSPALVPKPAPKTKKAVAAAPPKPLPPAKKATAGLTAPSRPADVNRIGILGALNSAGKPGQGVKAEQISQQGNITQTALASSAGAVDLTVKTAAVGDLGAGAGGQAVEHDPNALSAASTTLRGSGKHVPGSTGALALSSGSASFETGGSLGRAGGAGTGVGSFDGGNFSVEGGLDRETVRQVIQKTKNQMRACFEKALLTDPKAGGRLTFAWVITPAGPVTELTISKTTSSSDVLTSCVREVITTMLFPRAANGRSTRVIYPFEFQQR